MDSKPVCIFGQSVYTADGYHEQVGSKPNVLTMFSVYFLIARRGN